MRATIATAMFVSTVGAALHSVQNAVDNYCQVTAASFKAAGRVHPKDPKAFQRLMQEQVGMYANKLDCSAVTQNPTFGFNLEDATFTECMQGQQDVIAKFGESFQFDDFACRKSVINEEQKTAAIWVENVMTIGGYEQVNVVSVVRLSVNEDFKFTSYHYLYDTYTFFTARSAARQARQGESLELAAMSSAFTARSAVGLARQSESLKLATMSSVQNVVDNYCQVMGDFAKSAGIIHPKDPKVFQRLMQEQVGMYADKMDCSAVAQNPILGYSLEDATITECMQEQTEQWGQLDESFQFDHFACRKSIVNEEQKTAAIWAENVITVGGYEQVNLVSVVRLSVNEDFKLTSYHWLYDTYTLFIARSAARQARQRQSESLELAAMSSVHDAADNYCHVMGSSFKAAGTLHPNDPKVFQRFMQAQVGMYADKVDCSQVPQNPILGFSREDATITECMQGGQEAMVKFGESFQVDEVACQKPIINEEQKTAAIWVESVITVGGYEKVNMVTAVRLSVNEDFKLTSHHVLYDTYTLFTARSAARQARQRDESLMSTAPGKWLVVAGVVALVGATTTLVAFIKRGSQKNFVLLENEA